MKTDAVADGLKDNVATIVMIVGVTFAFIGLLYFSPLGSYVSAVSFVLAVGFLAFGLGIQLEFFAVNLRSREGIGSILFCGSFVMLATAVVLVVFGVPSIMVAPIIFKGSIQGYNVRVEVIRRIMWYQIFLGVIGIGSLIVGFVLRFRNELL